MKIDNYGAGKREAEALRLLLKNEDKISRTIERIVLLPIPTTPDGLNISGCDISLISVISELCGGDLVVGYGLPAEMREVITGSGAAFIDAADDELFLKRNELTAIGAIGYILGSCQSEPGEMRFGVVGYGRIGRLLVRYLLFFGARVRVYTTREEVRRELCEYGVSTAPTFTEDGVADFSGLDVLINTAPVSLSAGFRGGTLPGRLRVIELASGKNFEGVAGVERLAGIPGKSYPLSAGRAYFDAIMRGLSGEGKA